MVFSNAKETLLFCFLFFPSSTNLMVLKWSIVIDREGIVLTLVTQRIAVAVVPLLEVKRILQEGVG